MHPDQHKWDRIYSNRAATEPVAAEVLVQNQHLLPASGKALDLACGLGANSILLAENGLKVSSWDISPVAIDLLQKTAKQRAFAIDARVVDVMNSPLPPESFDVLLVTHFLVRGMESALISALKPGGLLFYQTFCRDKVSAQGPGNPDYLLGDNELLQMFAGLRIRVYREESRLGHVERGWRNQAMLVAERI